MKIRAFDSADESQVIALWDRCGLLRPWNDPKKDIQRKRAVYPDQFLVGVEHDTVIATAMVGYDGHRGWIYYLAVSPDRQRMGLGRAIVAEAERTLRELGCPKINLQVRSTNANVIAFYRRIGFVEDDVLSLGMRRTRADLIELRLAHVGIQLFLVFDDLPRRFYFAGRSRFGESGTCSINSFGCPGCFFNVKRS